MQRDQYPLIKIFFQDKIGSIHHSFGGGFLNIRLLTPDDAEEYAALRLEALRLNPEGFAMSYEEEQINTKDKYKARFASAQSMWTFGAFHQGQLVGGSHAHPRNLAEVKASSESDSDVCNT